MNRRDFLRNTSAALVIGFNLRDVLEAQGPGPAGPQPNAQQIDTWIAIHPDNTVTFYVGFAELGQGNSTALLQIAAEELDLDMDQIRTVHLETGLTPNQGGTYSSASIARGGPQVRAAAAEAKRALVELAAKRFPFTNQGPGVMIRSIRIAKGVVTVGDQSVTYGELIGGRRFNLAFGESPNPFLKVPNEYKLVGASPARKDTPAKVSGDYTYMQHMSLPGMLHGRIVRSRGQSAYGKGDRVLNVDIDSIASIPGVRLVQRGQFLGVIAEHEYDAIRAAERLTVIRDVPLAALPSNARLHDQMRAAQTTDQTPVNRGNFDEAYASAPFKSEGHFRGPYQMHAPFAPNCAVADVTPDSAHIVCSSQDVYATRRTLSRILGLDQSKIRVQYAEGSGTYGHSCYDDVAQAAAIMSQEAGRPVRVQFMRHDEHGWDLYGPPHIGEVRIGANEEGKLVAYEYHGWQHNWSNVETSEQLTGAAPAEWPGFAAQGVNQLTLGGMYAIPNLRLVNHKLNALEYLRAAWLRSPLDLSMSFASEQAIDDLAYQLELDPYEFRRRNISNERWLGVLDGAAKAAGWQPRRAASNLSGNDVVIGRGIGLGTHLQSWGGAVADIEVNKRTGKVRALHLYGAIDCGLAVNPGIVEQQIEGQLVQTASRMFLEEVKFSETQVTSLDWNSYPVIRFEDVPEVTPVVVQRIDERSSGAGEEVMAACAAAIANAFFDATGKRMHEYPFTPERVLAALA